MVLKRSSATPTESQAESEAGGEDGLSRFPFSNGELERQTGGIANEIVQCRRQSGGLTLELPQIVRRRLEGEGPKSNFRLPLFVVDRRLVPKSCGKFESGQFLCGNLYELGIVRSPLPDAGSDRLNPSRQAGYRLYAFVAFKQAP